MLDKGQKRVQISWQAVVQFATFALTLRFQILRTRVHAPAGDMNCVWFHGNGSDPTQQSCGVCGAKQKVVTSESELPHQTSSPIALC